MISMLVAWFGIQAQFSNKGFSGFPADGPRQEAFVDAGQLIHEIVRDVNNNSSGVHVRLTVRIELSHDRVLSHTIEHCLDNIVYASHSLYASVKAGDRSFVETYARNYLEAHNGSSAIKSVTLVDTKMLPPSATKSVSTPDLSRTNDGSAPVDNDEPSDAPKDRASRFDNGKSTSGPR
ncbi:MAG: hypothetical protein WBD31_23810 [Rubripirellula sp.]